MIQIETLKINCALYMAGLGLILYSSIFKSHKTHGMHFHVQCSVEINAKVT